MGDIHKIDGHKLDNHIDRVFEWKYRGDTAPVYVEVSPTASCNHKCSFCALDYTNHTNIKIPKQKLMDIGTQLGRLGVRSVMFGGEGEPTLHEDLAEAIAHYRNQGVDCAITTNGTGLGEAFAVEGGEYAKWVKVSMNGGDAETYAKVHGTSLRWFDRTWEGIEEFRKACRNGHPTVGVQAVALYCNLQSLPKLCKLAVERGLDYVVIKPFSHNGYSESCKNTKAPSPELVRAVAEECKTYETDRTKVVVRDCAIDSARDGASYPRCLSVPYFWAYINAKMDVIACPNHMLDNRFNLGNLGGRTLQDIWNSHSDNRREMLKQYMSDFDVSVCRKACRMDRVNEWLWGLQHPDGHVNFI